MTLKYISVPADRNIRVESQNSQRRVFRVCRTAAYITVQKLINKKNIKKLDLIWKRTSIKKGNFKSDYKQNIEINPIVINKKLILQ